MRCRKAFDVDVAAFLHDPDDAEVAEFRAHHAACADCAAEVAAWTELDRALRGGASADRHPAPEELLAFADRDAALTTTDRARLARHLAGCRSCTDEIAALGSFDFGVLDPDARAATEHEPRRHSLGAAMAVGNRDRTTVAHRSASHARPEAASRSAAVAAPESGRRGVGSRIRRIALHPAFAYGLVAVLLYPALRYTLPKLEENRSAQSVASAPRPLAEAPQRQLEVPLSLSGGADDSATAEARRRALTDAAKAAPGARKNAVDAPAVADVRGGSVGSSDADADAAGTGRERTATHVAEAPPMIDSPAQVAAEAEGGHGAREPREKDAMFRRDEARVAHERAAAPPAAPQPRAEVTSADASGRSPAPIVSLRTGETARIPLDETRDGVMLRIAIEDARGGFGEREVRIVSPGGRKEIRERIDVTGDPASLTIHVPEAWLTKGEYVVEVKPVERAAGPGAVGRRTGSFAFAVR